MNCTIPHLAHFFTLMLLLICSALVSPCSCVSSVNNLVSISVSSNNSSNIALINPLSPFLTQSSGPIITTTRTRVHTSRINCTSTTLLTLELALAYDFSFCQRFNSSARAASSFLRQVVRSISPIFQNSFCIRLRTLSIDSYCSSHSNPFRPPSSTVSNPLHYYASAWRQAISKHASRDAAIIFTGSSYSTPSSGTYRYGACNFTHGFAYIHGYENAQSAVLLARQLGYLLGASTSSSRTRSIMSKWTNPKTLKFSTYSKRQIFNFVNLQKTKSWCLREQYAIFATLQKRYKWNTPIPITAAEKVEIHSMAFNEQYENLYFLISESDNISVAVIRNMNCSKDKGCKATSSTKHSSQVLLKHGEEVLKGPIKRFGLTIFRRNRKSGIVICYTIPTKGVFLKIGFPFNENTLTVSSWTSTFKIPIPNVVAVSISYISESNQLLLAYAIKQHISRATRVFYRYASFTSLKPVLWTSAYEVPGYFGSDLSGLSVTKRHFFPSSQNTIEKGSTLIVYAADDTDGHDGGFLRFQREIDGNEQWSVVQRAPMLVPARTRRAGAMAIGRNNSIVLVQREQSVFSTVWNLYISFGVYPTYAKK